MAEAVLVVSALFLLVFEFFHKLRSQEVAKAKATVADVGQFKVEDSGLEEVGDLHALVGYDAVGPTRLELAYNLTVSVDFNAT